IDMRGEKRRGRHYCRNRSHGSQDRANRGVHPALRQVRSGQALIADPAPLGGAIKAAGINSRLNAASPIRARSQVAYRRKASEPMTSATPMATESQDG